MAFYAVQNSDNVGSLSLNQILNTDAPNITLNVSAGTGASFRTSNFLITLALALETESGVNGAVETFLCVSRSGDTLTLSNRALFGTTAQTWPIGSKVQMRLSSGHIQQLQDGISGINADKFIKHARLVSTVNLGLSGLSPIDGVTPNVGDRILAAGQTTQSENGLYAAASGAWSRVSDMMTATDFDAGLLVEISEGSHPYRLFVLTADNPITVGSTALPFLDITNQSSLTAGSGIIISGGVVSVDAPNVLLPTLGGILPLASGGTASNNAPSARGILGAAASGANSDITSLTGLTTPLAVTVGGTGATTTSGARTVLGAAASGANSDITSLTGLTSALPANEGGTGFAAGYQDGQVLIGNTSTGLLGRSTITAGGNITITNGPGTITIATSGSVGEANTASSDGLTGEGLTLSKSGVDLPFKNIDVGSNKLSVSTNVTNSTVELDVTEANITLNNIGGTLGAPKGGTGFAAGYTNGQLLIGNTGTGNLSKATITAGSGITVTNGAGSITIASTASGGTVTSVGLSMPGEFSVAHSPVTVSDTLAVTWASVAANKVFAGPTSGGSATPAMRNLVAADIPAHNQDASTITTGTMSVARLPAMVGDSGSGGTAGLVPAPVTGDAVKILYGNGTWAAVPLLQSLSGLLTVPLGGTGATTLANHAVLLGAGTSAITTQALTDGQVLIGSTGNAPAAAALTGTANRVTVTSASGSITISAPQDIHTAATPTFAGMTLTGRLVGKSAAYNAVTYAASGSIATTDSIAGFNATTGAIGAQLPLASAALGQQFIVYKTDSSANAVTVGRQGSDVIVSSGGSPATTVVLATQYSGVVLAAATSGIYLKLFTF